MIKSSPPRLTPAFLLMLLAMLSACQPGQLFGPRVLYASTPTFPPFPQPTATPPLPTAPTQTPAPPPMVVPRQVREDVPDTYSVVMNYPYLEQITDPRFGLFNEVVNSTIAGIRQDFTDGLNANPATPDPNLSPSFLQTDYSITHGTSGLVSVLFTVSYYVSGAAHPNQYAVSLNLDIANARVLKLADLFKPGVDYLQVISDYCIQDLKRRNVLEWDTGALPVEENYRTWNLTQDGLLISFDPYEVASYARGPQAVTIPYASLKDIFDPTGPLATILQ
jgi:hypothetical protein